MDVFLAFFAYYVSLATVFVPLTFALTISLKDQYQKSLDNKAISAEHNRLLKFRDAFFGYNDAFSELIVVTAILGMAAVVAVIWVFHWEMDPAAVLAPPGEKRCEELSAVLGLLCLWIGSTKYVAWRHAYLHTGFWAQTPPDTLKVFNAWASRILGFDLCERLHFLSTFLFLRSGGKLAGLIQNLAARDDEDVRAQPNHKWRLVPVFGLQLANLALLLSICTLIFFGSTAEYAMLLLALHGIAVLFFWWELYNAWAPFTELSKVEAVAISREYADEFLKSPYAEQKRTYQKFMWQYEDDDVYRASKEVIKTALKGLDSKISDKKVGLKEWRDQAKLASGLGLKVPVIYVGSGHGELLSVLREEVAAWLGAPPQRIDLVAVEWLTEGDDEGRRTRARIDAAEAVCLKDDVYKFVAALSSDAHIDIYPQDKKWDDVKERLKNTIVPPLVVLLNTTYGALISSTVVGSPASTLTRTASDDPVDALRELQERSGREFFTALKKSFETVGFGALVHSKRAGWLPQHSSPYTVNRWIELRGTDSMTGLFFLGRYANNDNSGKAPKLCTMLVRWLRPWSFRKDFEGTDNGRTIVGCDREDEASPYLWCGASYLSVARRYWSTVTDLPSSYEVGAEIEILGVTATPGWSKNACLVDIGCADGTFASALHKKWPVGEYWGYDLNSELRLTSTKATELKLPSPSVADLADLRGGSYSGEVVVLLWNVLPYLSKIDVEVIKTFICWLVALPAVTTVRVVASAFVAGDTIGETAKFCGETGPDFTVGTELIKGLGGSDVSLMDYPGKGTVRDFSSTEIKKYYSPKGTEPFMPRRVLVGRFKPKVDQE